MKKATIKYNKKLVGFFTYLPKDLFLLIKKESAETGLKIKAIIIKGLKLYFNIK
jgi:hypothetical protein